MENIDTIINEIKKGRTYTVACSMYEEYFWYEEGEFFKAMENGVCEPRPKKTTEEMVRKGISMALHNPEMYDGFFDFEG